MRGGKRLNRDALSLRGLYEWVQVLVCAVTATVLLFTFAARVVLVSGPSMRETLQHQDCLLVMNAHLCDLRLGTSSSSGRRASRTGSPS